MLQRAAAAPPEMAAYRLRPARHGGGEALHHPALSPGTAARTDFGAHPVAGDGKWQEDGLATPLGNPITLRTEPVDGEFNKFASESSLRSPLHRSEIC